MTVTTVFLAKQTTVSSKGHSSGIATQLQLFKRTRKNDRYK